MTPSEPRVDLRFLDGLRGLAALYVVAGHARWLLWEGYSAGYVHHPGDYSAAGRALVLASGTLRYGHQAVMFFFVISGFVIHLRYARQLERDPLAPFDLGPYLVRRVRRIYPPFLLSVGLTWALDLLGSQLGYGIYTGQTAYPLINSNVTASHSAGTLAASLLFVAGQGLPVWGTNGPLWSLMLEGWFYVLYPALFWLFRRSPTAPLVLLLAAGVGLQSTAAAFTLRYMAIWGLGALLAERWAGRLQGPHVERWSAALLAGLAMPFLDEGWPRDLLMGLVFMGLLAAGLGWVKQGRALGPLVKLKPLGDISYSLYILHFPLLALLSGALQARSPQGLLPQTGLWAALAVGLSLLLAWAGYRVAERPFLRGEAARPT